MNKKIRGWAVAWLTIINGLLILGCGGRSMVSPECRPEYDHCINGCADRCDQSRQADPRSNSRGPLSGGFQGESANTWGSGCEPCVRQCRDIATQCKKRMQDIPRPTQ